jgi:hypothetical protein
MGREKMFATQFVGNALRGVPRSENWRHFRTSRNATEGVPYSFYLTNAWLRRLDIC